MTSFKLYLVTCSYSSHPFSCALALCVCVPMMPLSYSNFEMSSKNLSSEQHNDVVTLGRKLSCSISVETWREVDCGSPRHPPCEKLSLTRVDRQRALLFGGKQEKFSDEFNKAFILHLDTLVSYITIVPSYTGKYHEFVAICIVTSAQHK